jgi:SAM-dependent methyltransferase
MRDGAPQQASRLAESPRLAAPDRLRAAQGGQSMALVDLELLRRSLTQEHYAGQNAEQYNTQPGHGFATPEERAAFIQDLLDAVDLRRPEGDLAPLVLDVGTGTGLLARIFVERGFRVVGIDVADDMLEQVPADLRERGRFFQADCQEELVPSVFGFDPIGAFDLVVSRQVICHFGDPIGAFRNWYVLLKPGGAVVAIDGLWSRESWEVPLDASDPLPAVDVLPLSALGSRGTVAYLLKHVGFDVERIAWLGRQNRELKKQNRERAQQSGQTEAEFVAPRYVIVARKPGAIQ